MNKQLVIDALRMGQNYALEKGLDLATAQFDAAIAAVQAMPADIPSVCRRSDCALFDPTPEWVKLSDAIEASPPQGSRMEMQAMSDAAGRIILAAGLASGDEGTARLAAQLAGVPPCPVCNFRKEYCRCDAPADAPDHTAVLRQAKEALEFTQKADAIGRDPMSHMESVREYRRSAVALQKDAIAAIDAAMKENGE